MKLARALRGLLLIAALGWVSTPAGAVAVGQIDDFEDGTVQNWVVGLGGGGEHPFPPENVPTGGPAGDDDNYLLISAIGGNGPGSRLAVINITQWAGDYITAGVGQIGVHFNNFSDTDLYLRLLFEDPMGGPPLNVATTEAFLAPAGSGWTYAVFSVGASDLIPLLGDVNTLLGNTTAIRIFHNPDPAFPPPPVVARLGVDNIEALGEPTATESSTWGRLKSLYR